MATLEFESEPDEGVFQIVYRAAAMVGELSDEPVATLEITSAGSPGEPEVTIEATFGQQGARRALARLGARAHVESPQHGLSRKQIDTAVRQFGGTDFTNLCARKPDQPERELDVTVSFPSWLKLMSETVLLVPESVEADDSGIYLELLGALGVRARAENGTLSCRRRQLRSAMSEEAQADAYSRARRAGLSTSLYAATIPATQTMRIEELGERADVPDGVDIYLGRGLTAGSSSSEEDAQAMQAYLSETLGVRWGPRRYSVDAQVGEIEVPQPAQRAPGVRFTFWIKGNRR